jgi:hypothetical protein
MTTIAEKLLEYIQRHDAKELTMAQIARLIGTTQTSVATAACMLVKIGVLFRADRGRYRATGKAWISGHQRAEIRKAENQEHKRTRDAAIRGAAERAIENAEARRLSKLEAEIPLGFSYPASAAERAMRHDHDRKIYRHLVQSLAA